MNSDVYRSLKSELNKGQKAVLITLIEREGGSRAGQNKILLTENQLRDPTPIGSMDNSILNKAQSVLKSGALGYFQTPEGGTVLIEPYFPEPHLIVLGGRHIAKPVVEFGAKAGFSVIVVDDRPIFASKDRFPDAEEVICANFNDCFAQFDLNEYSFVVIMTREHGHDLDCLKQVLKRDTAYIGMIGSRHSVDVVKEQLLQDGYPMDIINRVNAPIGLEIGAITPEEIAISIIAQAIRRRRVPGGAPQEDKVPAVKNWPEFDRPVLEELCKDTSGSKALITIISTTGSAPVKVGTKMLVWSYGMTVGSVGGGYAEGEVINAAWQIMGSGSSRIYEIDMTGQTAEEQGMVCGGSMKVLIEDYTG